MLPRWKQIICKIFNIPPMREAKPAAGREVMPAAMKRDLLEAIRKLRPDARAAMLCLDRARGESDMADSISMLIHSCPDTGE
jgi:hypothetical protein